MNTIIIHENGGNGEGGSGGARAGRTLRDVMRGPSTKPPEIVVVETLQECEARREERLNPKEDLWISSADGRYNSPIVPLRVGEIPNIETFFVRSPASYKSGRWPAHEYCQVHKNVLTKADYFKKALCGDFREARAQEIDLPEEDPAIFHFLVSFLYEGVYQPIKPAAAALGGLQSQSALFRSLR
jgi:hypothetical protein